MNVRHETNIDTVAIQLEFKTGLEQRNKFNLIYNWTIGRGLGKLELNEERTNHRVNIYDLMSGKSKLATLHTGFSKNFYIRIRWCGLKSFKSRQDEKSFSSLMTICALLNTTRSNYRFVELDIALDLFCPFNKVLAMCINPVNNVPYNTIGRLQFYKDSSTNYIEDYKDKKKRKYAMKRSYLYHKSNKEDLDYYVTRFEIKLQNHWFLRYEFNLDIIIRVLDKYAVFYLNDSISRRTVINQLKDTKTLSNNQLLKLERKYKRIYHDTAVIKEFIRKVKSVYVDFFGNVRVPSISDDELQ